jgi:predicted DNA-binding ribbon-helix-helix protein
MEPAAMKSQVVKRSIMIHGHRTSVSVEEAFWKSLQEIARLRGKTLTQLVANIDAERKFANLSSAIRLFVLEYYQDQYNSGSKPDLAARPFVPAMLGEG